MRRLDRPHGDTHLGDDLSGDLVLDREDVGKLAIVPLGPEVASRHSIAQLRDKPMIVLSGYRSPEHNRRVGGAAASKHMEGTAFDIAMANHDPVAFEAAARKAGFLGSASTRARVSCTSTSARLEALTKFLA